MTDARLWHPRLRIMIDRRGGLRLVAVEAASLRTTVHPLPALRVRLASWGGIGAIEDGMARQGVDLQLTRYD
jgi:hypothetical protein